MAKELISSEGNPDRIPPLMPVGQDKAAGGPVPEGAPFSQFMEQAAAGPAGTAKAPLASPFELTGRPNMPVQPTLDTLMSQVNNTHSTLGDLNTYLKDPNLKLKQSSKYVVKNKLEDASQHMRNATTRLGVEQKGEQEISPSSGPLAKFINYVTNGQNQMEAAKHQLAAMKDSGDNMRPGDFLLIQTQLNLAQQSLEYSSVVLSKAMDDVKMMMNVQL
jgi:hypothetical protein